MSNEAALESLQEDIVELQTKLQFQEDTIQQLDKVIVEQNGRIEILTQQLRLLDDKLKDAMQNQNGTKSDQQERPPHY